VIVLFTDFGVSDAYVGQMRAALASRLPGAAVVDLLHSVPRFDVRAAAYLLPAYVDEFAPGTVFCCVVDPGVGGERRAVMLQVDGRWFVGPDNGLFSVLLERAAAAECREILWRPPSISTSFHGRDLFAPACAMLAGGEMPASAPCTVAAAGALGWPDDLARVIYVDHYGNAMTGLRGQAVAPEARLEAGGRVLAHARTFSDVAPGLPFWYVNANGLVELAVNQGSAREVLGLRVGSETKVLD
jgi:S-adenosylmethionine hydrolase